MSYLVTRTSPFIRKGVHSQTDPFLAALLINAEVRVPLWSPGSGQRATHIAGQKPTRSRSKADMWLINILCDKVPLDTPHTPLRHTDPDR